MVFFDKGSPLKEMLQHFEKNIIVISHVTRVFNAPASAHLIVLSEPQEAKGKTCFSILKSQ